MMENSDKIFADFMAEKTFTESKEKGEMSKAKKTTDGKVEELSEEEKELQESKKSLAATAKRVGFNPALAVRQTKKMLFVYFLVGLLVLGIMVFSKRNKGWFSKGITKSMNFIMFGDFNAR